MNSQHDPICMRNIEVNSRRLGVGFQLPGGPEEFHLRKMEGWMVMVVHHNGKVLNNTELQAWKLSVCVTYICHSAHAVVNNFQESGLAFYLLQVGSLLFLLSTEYSRLASWRGPRLFSWFHLPCPLGVLRLQIHTTTSG